MRESLEHLVRPEEVGLLVRELLVSAFALSKRAITGLKSVPEGITLNAQQVTVRQKVQPGDLLRIKVMDEGDQALGICPVAMDLAICYEDGDYLVVDKPWAMPVHPSRAHGLDSLGNGVIHYLSQKGEATIYRPMTRLDKDTSGLVLIAKSAYAQSQLASQPITKEYLAWVAGTLPGAGRIELPIARQEPGSIKRAVDAGGKYACTDYQVLRESEGNSLILVTLHTGRTHQIRVHFAHLGHPLLGDKLYGGDCSHWPRQALHAHRLAFLQPITKVKVDLVSAFEEGDPN